MKDLKNLKFEDQIINKIKEGKVKLRSKYYFLAKNIGLSGVFFLSILLAAFFINLAFYYVKSIGYLEYLSFGKDGIFAILESFPYLWIMGAIVFLFIASYLITKNDISYKKPFLYLVAGILVFVVLSGGVMARSGANENFEERVLNKEKGSKVLKQFYGRKDKIQFFAIAGKVKEVNESSLVIVAPRGEITIESAPNRQLDLSNIELENFIIAVGRKGSEGIFTAVRVKTVERKNLPRIKRQIEQRFPRAKPADPRSKQEPRKTPLLNRKIDKNKDLTRNLSIMK